MSYGKTEQPCITYRPWKGQEPLCGNCAWLEDEHHASKLRAENATLRAELERLTTAYKDCAESHLKLRIEKAGVAFELKAAREQLIMAHDEISDQLATVARLTGERDAAQQEVNHFSKQNLEWSKCAEKWRTQASQAQQALCRLTIFAKATCAGLGHSPKMSCGCKEFVQIGEKELERAESVLPCGGSHAETECLLPTEGAHNSPPSEQLWNAVGNQSDPQVKTLGAALRNIKELFDELGRASGSLEDDSFEQYHKVWAKIEAVLAEAALPSDTPEAQKEAKI
jgi:hypothetical protein